MRSPFPTLFTALLLVFSYCSRGQVTVVSKAQLPSKITYKGVFIEGRRWADNEGEHLVMTTETAEHLMQDQTKYKGTEDEGREARLNAYMFNYRNGQWQQAWMVNDFVSECTYDVTAKFIPNTFTVTDLDKDGAKEVWMMYVTACTSDVSPMVLKIIMYTRGKKYAVRGTTQVTVSATEIIGGEYKMDDAFTQGPEIFRQYAASIWKKNMKTN